MAETGAVSAHKESKAPDADTDDEDDEEGAGDGGIGGDAAAGVSAGPLATVVTDAAIGGGFLLKPLLRRLGDPSEPVREAAALLLAGLLRQVGDLAPVLPLLLPALMERCASDAWGYDLEQKVFVMDQERHERHRMGRVTGEAAGALGGAETVGGARNGAALSIPVAERAEEVRLVVARCLQALMDRAVQLGSVGLLYPRFHDLVLASQAFARDPYPSLRCLGLRLVTQLVEVAPHITKHFAPGLVRAIAPGGLDHRLRRVRLAALPAVSAVVACRDEAKLRGAGTEAIADLVGYRDENVIPLTAFYGREVAVNLFGKLVADPAPSVRLGFYRMVGGWMWGLPDRFDHESRLLPFLLSGLGDADPIVRGECAQTLAMLGDRYEAEQEDRLQDRRQYGVDGLDGEIDYNASSKPYPPPFHTRPGVGTRLLVRANVKRWLKPVLAELQGVGSISAMAAAQAAAGGAGSMAAEEDAVMAAVAARQGGSGGGPGLQVGRAAASTATQRRAAVLLSLSLVMLEEHFTEHARDIARTLLRLAGWDEAGRQAAGSGQTPYWVCRTWRANCLVLRAGGDAQDGGESAQQTAAGRDEGGCEAHPAWLWRCLAGQCGRFLRPADWVAQVTPWIRDPVVAGAAATGADTESLSLARVLRLVWQTTLAAKPAAVLTSVPALVDAVLGGEQPLRLLATALRSVPLPESPTPDQESLAWLVAGPSPASPHRRPMAHFEARSLGGEAPQSVGLVTAVAQWCLALACQLSGRVGALGGATFWSSGRLRDGEALRTQLLALCLVLLGWGQAAEAAEAERQAVVDDKASSVLEALALLQGDGHAAEKAGAGGAGPGASPPSVTSAACLAIHLMVGEARDGDTAEGFVAADRVRQSCQLAARLLERRLAVEDLAAVPATGWSRGLGGSAPLGQAAAGVLGGWAARGAATLSAVNR